MLTYFDVLDRISLLTTGGDKLNPRFKSVKAFLKQVFEYINSGSSEIIAREKNKIFAQNYGLRTEHLITIIKKLHSGLKYNGPMEENDMTYGLGTVYVFYINQEIDGESVSIYIKLKIPDDRERVLILSIHEEERQ
jgi:hypothetical protein